MKKLAICLLVLALILGGCVKQPTDTSTPSSQDNIPVSSSSSSINTTNPPTTSSPSSPSTQPTQTTPPGADVLKVVGQVGGPTQAVAVSGDYAYVGIGLRLEILNISNPATPLEVGVTEPFGYYIEDVSVVDGKAYVAAGSSGLNIVDVSNPARPVILGNLDTQGYTEGVVVEGQYAYVADGPCGLRIVDVSNPAKPTEIANIFNLNYVFDVVIEDRYAYLAAAGAGLLIADIYDPIKPKEVSFLDTPGYAYSVIISEATAYIADGWGGIRVADVSNPTQPKEIGTFNTTGWALDIVLDGNKAYIAGGTFGLRIIDISNKINPKEIGSYGVSGGNAIKLAFSNGVAYLADRVKGLGFFDVSVPAEPIQFGYHNPMAYADSVTVSGDYAYVAAGFNGLRVIDISDLSRPREVGVYETRAYATGVVTDGNYAYVISWDGLHIVDISNPKQPNLVSFFDISGCAQDIVIHENCVYIANELGLQIIDVSNAAFPVQIGAVDFSHDFATTTTIGVAVSRNTAYITHTTSGLKIVDISNPANLAVEASFKPDDFRKVLGVATDGSFVYVTDLQRLHVVDISNVKDPKEVGFYDLLATAERVAFFSNAVYIAGAAAGLFKLDVSNPHNPIMFDLQRLPGYALGLSFASGFIFVADGEGGLFIIEDTSISGEVSSTLSKQTGKSITVESPITLSIQPLAIEKLELGENNNPPVSGRVLIVTSTADSGQGTLRWALENAGEGDTITFDSNVFPPQSPASIKIDKPLPTLNQDYTNIDASNAGVILDGRAAHPGTSGLTIGSNYNKVKGLQIVNFPDCGICILGAYNLIGGDRTKGNGPMGEGNLISGNNFTGVMIKGTLAVNNNVSGNFIGTDTSGSKSLGKQTTGVFIGQQAAQNIIGGSTEDNRNIISGNLRAEVSLMGAANRNKIIGNYVGTDVQGQKILSFAVMGVSIEQSAFNNIIEKNVISNNGNVTVIISDWGSWYNEVTGNYIGLDATGTSSLGGIAQGIGVNESFNRIGGTMPEERNIISGNGGQGIKIGMSGTTDVMVIGNYIGTDVTRTKAIGNGSDGIAIMEGGTHHTFIGGANQNERNVISGNSGGGILVSGIGSDNNFISNNHIGTDPSGNGILPNQGNGVSVKYGECNHIKGNKVHHNLEGGIVIQSANGNCVYLNSIVESGMSVDGGNNNLWDSGEKGNYWSDYKGKDSNGDGIGDTPYQISPNGIDRYPLMKPL